MQDLHSADFVSNFSQGIHRTKSKFGNDDKKCEICGIKYKYCDCFLEYINFKDDLIEYKYLCCNKSYQQVWWKVEGTIFKYIQIF